MAPPSHDDPAPPADLRPHLALFSHIACRPEDELDLGQAALVIAEPEYDGLDVAAYLRRLDRLAERAQPRVARIPDPGAQALALINYLHVEEGFCGNVAEYDDPRNSFLNEVLDRRLGIPITLSVVMIEVARRLGVPLRGVSFPGHFLLRVDLLTRADDSADDLGGVPGDAAPDDADAEASDDGDGDSSGGLSEVVVIDPFDGRSLDAEDLQALLVRVTGQRRAPRVDDIEIASKHAILLRMLNNLRNLYVQSGDARRLTLARERIRALEAYLSPGRRPSATPPRGTPPLMN